MTATAKGAFTVDMKPQNDADGASIGRMLLDKHYTGDLVATARGQMLAAMTAVQGSAGYVAIERVTGRLAGRDGSFVLQHSGSMDRGVPSLSITVVPDSGTDGLAGLRGTLKIDIQDGAHFYELAYELACDTEAT
jgi:hypothetical protein